MEGLLFYSIDKHSNQLIVQLKDRDEPLMELHFRNQRYKRNLETMCNCQTGCLYERLNFRFQIKETLEVQCNNMSANVYEYGDNRLVREDYPIPNFKDSNASAYLWLTNIPKYKNENSIFQSNLIPSGCLFDVYHNNKVLNLSRIGTFGSCIPKCKSSICNFGKCLETFKSPVHCDCSALFMNGDFCDEIHHFTGVSSGVHRIEKLKISFSCSSPEDGNILFMSNGREQIAVVVEGGTFQFIYKDPGITLSRNIMKYRESECILILSIEKSGINYHLNCSGTVGKGIVKEVLSSKQFKEIKMSNKICKGDAVYQELASKWRWKSFYEGKDRNILHLCIWMLGALNVTLLILFICIWKWRTGNRIKERNNILLKYAELQKFIPNLFQQ